MGWLIFNLQILQLKACFRPFIFCSGQLCFQFSILGEESGVGCTFWGGQFFFYFCNLFFQFCNFLLCHFHRFLCFLDGFVAFLQFGVGEE